MGEAVQHRPSLRQPPHCPAVVFLVQEKAGFLSVFYIYQIFYAVLYNLRYRRIRRGLPRQGKPFLVLLQSLLLPEGDIIPLEDAPNSLPVLPKNPDQKRQQQVLDPLHAHRQHLDAEEVMELVHCQAGEHVGFPEDDAAGVQILGSHDRFPVLPGPAELPLPEGGVKAVVGVPGNQADPDFRFLRQEAGAQVRALPAPHIHQPAVLQRALHRQNFRVVDPGMPPENSRLGFWGDCNTGICPLCFHNQMTSRLFSSPVYHTFGGFAIGFSKKEELPCPLYI